MPDWTPEEIVRYATFHWLMVGEKAAHVWRSIGGESTYLGTAEDIAQGREPAEQIPLVPTLDLPPQFGGGPTSAAGGVIPNQPEKVA